MHKTQKNVFYAVRFSLHVYFILAVILTSLQANAADITGIWMKDDLSARLRLAPCGALICGRLIWLKNPRKDIYNPNRVLRTEPLTGQRMLWDLDFLTSKHSRPKGRFYNYEDGRVYDVLVDLQNNRMFVQGCVSGGVICIKTTWLKSD